LNGIALLEARMTRLEVNRLIPRTEVSLRTGPNWTGVVFFGTLSLLHIYIATTAFLQQRWEGFMSWVFAGAFAIVALIFWRAHRELALQTPEKRLRLRTGTRRFYFERFIAFSQVRDVRLTLVHPKHPEDATIEIVCDFEVIECPPTNIPREEALCLAMNIGVGLTKVYSNAFGPAAERLDQLPRE